VAAGSLRKTREVEDFGGKTHGNVFPDGGVQALHTVLIAVALCLDPAEALDPVFGRAVLGSGGGIGPGVRAGRGGGPP